jgi:pimeloyl-ACP methyl ester carboxylesterase
MHHFSGIKTAADGTVALSLDGGVAGVFSLTGGNSNTLMLMFDLYPVEASSNLAEWTRSAVLVRTNNDPRPLYFQETNAAELSQRFYRTPTNHLVTGFPKPTGPYFVGAIDRLLTDPSRSNRYGIKTNSSFMSTFWYPAQPPKAGSIPEPYADRAVAADRAFYSYWGWSLPWTAALPQFVAHSVPGLPLASGTNRFPLILHSHGSSCDRKLNSQAAVELASYGYIVAAVDHEDAHATVFPDARGVRYVSPWASVSDPVRSRIRDIQYLLDELGRMDQADSLLAGRLDLDRVGLMGMSYGGGTAAEVGRLDSRARCVALLDAYIDFSDYLALNSQGLQKPFLAMNRTLLQGMMDLSPASQRLYTLAKQDAIWFFVGNTQHFGFTDLAWTVDLTKYSRPGAEVINACLRWFFDTYLKGETPSFPTNPEIQRVQRK